MNRYKKILLTAGVTLMAGSFAVFGAAGMFSGNGVFETEESDVEITLKTEKNSAPHYVYDAKDEKNENEMQQESRQSVNITEQEDETNLGETGLDKTDLNEADSDDTDLDETDNTDIDDTLEEAPDAVLEKHRKMFVGEKTKLKLKKATGELEWNSSDLQIVQVDDKGVVTAKKSGEAVVTVKQYDKEYSCKVTVKAPKWKQAYGITLSQMKNHEKASFMIRNIDGKKEPELIVVDHLPVTLKDNKKKTGTATYYDIGKEASKKTVSIYTYRRGKAVLLKRIKYKDNLNIMASHRSGKLMIMDMKGGKTTYHFVSMSGGKIKTSTATSYRGDEYKIAVVTRSSKAVIKKDLKYEKE